MRQFYSFFLFLMVTSVFGQINFIDNVTVLSINGDTIDQPWTGGINFVQFNQMDLNNDGIEDLVLVEEGTYCATKCYINNGIQGEISYTRAPKYDGQFPKISSWGKLVDYNCDGKKDLFSHRPAGIRVHKNVSTEDEIKFELAVDMIYTDKINLYASGGLTPVFYDIDGDSDIDIFTFGVNSNSLELYRNTSIENHGTCEHLEYELDTECWGLIEDNETDNEVALNVDCGNRGSSEILHSNNLLYMDDFDADGDLDMTIGNHYINQVIYLENTGTNDSPLFESFEGGFPQESKAIDIPSFPYITLMDLNNDSLPELIASPDASFGSDNHHGVWLYEWKNKQAGVYEFVKDGFLQDETLDFGSNLSPHFLDLNGDGLDDILIGSFYYYIEENSKPQMIYMENIGTQSNPSYQVKDSNILETIGPDPFYLTVTSGDLDNDGDLDLITGNYQGTLTRFTNIGTSTSPEFVQDSLKFSGIDVGSYSNPKLVDMNNDGLLDLLIGEEKGYLEYYQNSGTIGNPIFSNSPTVDTLANFAKNRSYGIRYSNPVYFEQNDSNFLFVSCENGYIYQYYDDNGNFEIMDSISTGGMRVTMDVADINNDGTVDFVMGEAAGGLQLFSLDDSSFTVSANTLQSINEDFTIYPNPGNGLISITNPERFESVRIKNTNGQQVITCHPLNINVSALPNGVYIIEALSHNQTLVRRKFIKL